MKTPYTRLSEIAETTVVAAGKVFPGARLSDLADRLNSLTTCIGRDDEETLRNLHILHAASGQTIRDYEKSVADERAAEERGRAECAEPCEPFPV